MTKSFEVRSHYSIFNPPQKKIILKYCGQVARKKKSEFYWEGIGGGGEDKGCVSAKKP